MTPKADKPEPEQQNPYAVPLAELVGQALVPLDEQVEEQPIPSLRAAAWDENRRQAELAGGA